MKYTSLFGVMDNHLDDETKNWKCLLPCQLMALRHDLGKQTLTAKHLAFGHDVISASF